VEVIELGGRLVRRVVELGAPPRVKNHEGLGADDAAVATEVVDYRLQMLHARDTQADQSVGITGDREHLDDLRQSGRGPRDRLNLRVAGEAEFGKGLQPHPEATVINQSRVPSDDADSFQPVDAPFYGRRRQVHMPGHVEHRSATVGNQQVKDRSIHVVDFIGGVHRPRLAGEQENCAGMNL
jgi:hypothetical protein